MEELALRKRKTIQSVLCVYGLRPFTVLRDTVKLP
jgi:hypothetical protein